MVDACRTVEKQRLDNNGNNNNNNNNNNTKNVF